ncbi:MAG: AI-2E family transporter [Ekhidna sp.]
MNISFKSIFYVIASIIGLVVILSLAKNLLIPLCFAMLFAFILYPIIKWLVKKGLNKAFSIAMTMSIVIILLLGVIVLFSAQIIDISGQYSNLFSKLKDALDASTSFLNTKVQLIPDIQSKELLNQLSEFFSDNGFLMVSDTVGITSSFFTYLVLTIIYTFLILLYSNHLVSAIGYFSPKKSRDSFHKMLKEVQEVGQQYLTGMVLLILILGLLNSIGLLIVGIEYSFLFGFLAALLAVIPYVGSTIGGLIPTFYAFINYDSYWYPVGVIIVFAVIQFIEGNVLSPRIVGGSLKINALFSILSLIAGSFLWGISGMILFLPMVAMLKVVCFHYDELKPISMLLGNMGDVEIVEVDLEEKKNNILKRLWSLRK